MHRNLRFSLLFLLCSFSLSACAQEETGENFTKSTTFDAMNAAPADNAPADAKTLAVATFGAGCFWCTEAQFQQLDGVDRVESGFMGGSKVNPTYKEVCTGTTGHAEVTNVYYNPAKISFDELLAAFWTAHDPTQLNRQGNDVGTQYRSVVFYHNDEQRRKAEDYKKKLNAEHAYNAPVVTEISPAKKFYIAEAYHQDYYNQNGGEPYCKFVVQPKVEKFRKVFAEKLKK